MSERPPFPFIVGCGRSGTTLVRAMLDAHCDFAVPFESYFPVWFARRRAHYERPDGFAVDPFLADLLAHESFRRWGLDDDTVRASIAAAAPRDYPAAVRAAFACYATAHGKRRYADKTPVFVVHLPLLAQLFPESVFVHLVRDGRAVVLSRAEVAWGTNRLEFETLTWREQVEQGRADGRALGAHRYREIRYEDLLDDPEQVARDLCAFVGAGFDAGMLRYHERAESILADQPFPEEHGNLTRPPTKGLRDWRTELAPDDVALVEHLAGDTLAAFGYERVTAATPNRVRARAIAARARYAAVRGYRSARRAAWQLAHPTTKS
jgi:hypothetical protein